MISAVLKILVRWWHIRLSAWRQEVISPAIMNAVLNMLCSNGTEILPTWWQERRAALIVAIVSRLCVMAQGNTCLKALDGLLDGQWLEIERMARMMKDCRWQRPIELSNDVELVCRSNRNLIEKNRYIFVVYTTSEARNYQRLHAIEYSLLTWQSIEMDHLKRERRLELMSIICENHDVRQQHQ